MFARALIALFLVAGCTREPAQKPPESKQKPDTAGVEGHGGIAVVEPKVGAATPIPAPLECDGGQSAKDLFLQAYATKETNPDQAAALFQKVVGCTRADDEYHQKARRQIEQLRP
jgi:hypothetical protein